MKDPFDHEGNSFEPTTTSWSQGQAVVAVLSVVLVVIAIVVAWISSTPSTNRDFPYSNTTGTQR